MTVRAEASHIQIFQCFSADLWSAAQLNSDQSRGGGGIYHDLLWSTRQTDTTPSTSYQYSLSHAASAAG